MILKKGLKFSSLFFPVFFFITGLIYGGIMLKMERPFEAYTSFFISITLTGFTLWIENKVTETATENQIIAILSNLAFSKKRNLVWNFKVEQLLSEINELDTQSIALSEDQLEEYTTKVLQHVARQSMVNKTYCATHIVNNKKYLNVWGKECPYHKSMEEFVAPQRDILNRGGSVTRIFIFTEDYLNNNVDDCEDMLAYHDRWYEGTKNKIETRFVVAESLNLTSHDITIVNNQFVFEWYRNLTNDYGYAGGKCYIKSDMKRYLDLFEKLKRRSHPTVKLREYLKE